MCRCVYVCQGAHGVEDIDTERPPMRNIDTKKDGQTDMETTFGKTAERERERERHGLASCCNC